MTMNKDEKYMKIAYEEAIKALEIDEVPIGAIIVKDDKIISKAFNKRETDQNAISHAETIAISEACKKLNSWRLDDCTLYVTLEPCIMCTGAIINSRIRRVVYGTNSDRWTSLNNILSSDDINLNHYPEVVSGILKDECSTLIKDYFRKKR